MIIIEAVVIDGQDFTYTHSGTRLIRKVGTNEIYEDALDVQGFIYEETDMLLPVREQT